MSFEAYVRRQKDIEYARKQMKRIDVPVFNSQESDFHAVNMGPLFGGQKKIHLNRVTDLAKSGFNGVLKPEGLEPSGKTIPANNKPPSSVYQKNGQSPFLSQIGRAHV